MKKILCLFLTLLLGISLNAQTWVPGGSVEGTWTLEGSPYIILGDIEINYSDFLIIEPGVEVKFNWSYTLFVNGTILAQGTEADSITFTAVDTDAGWRSIRFLNTPLDNDSSRFAYCIFKHGKAFGDWPDNCGGVIAAINYGKFVVDHCLFTENEATDTTGVGFRPGGAALAFDGCSPIIKNSKFNNNIATTSGAIICYNNSNPWIINNEFSYNQAFGGSGSGHGYGGAITCWIDSDPIIINNTFFNNLATEAGGAIAVVGNCSPVIQRNLIYNNTAYHWGGGIEILDGCLPKILNNTIANNTAIIGGGGIDIWLNSSPEIKNNIIWYNSAGSGGSQVWIDCDGAFPEFLNCNIQYGIDSIVGSGCIAEYKNCIDCEPKFEDPVNGNYQITWASWPVNDSTKCQCIDAGAGGDDPDGTDYDIGALFFDQTPETPNAYEAVNVTPEGFTAHWNNCAGAAEYRLDVAYDPAFNDYVEGFEDLPVPDTFLDVIVPSGGDHYYRVSAFNSAVTSDHSNTIFVYVPGISIHENPDIKPVQIIPSAAGLRVVILDDEYKNSELSMYNLLGQHLFNGKLRDGSNYIPLENQGQILILCIRKGNKIYSEKIMIR